MQVRPRPRPYPSGSARGLDVTHEVELDETGARAAADVFRLLADPTRLSLVWHLRDGEQSVNGLAALVERPAAGVSQHLAKLRLAHLVRTRRDGTRIWYALADDHVGRLVVDALAHTEHTEEPA